jgi:hypothetical protein
VRLSWLHLGADLKKQYKKPTLVRREQLTKVAATLVIDSRPTSGT